MVSKFITILYLISLSATLWMIFRYQIRVDNVTVLKKVCGVFLGGYFLALMRIFINNYQWGKPLLFLAMLSFCPFILFIIFLFKKYDYKGDLSVLLLAFLLNSLGLVALYRLDINSTLFGQEIPHALKHLVFSMISVLGIVVCVIKGFINVVLDKIESQTSYLYWGFVSIILLALPKIAGGSLMSQDKSIQLTEFAFKIMFLIFIALYFKSRASELVLERYPLRDVLKLVAFVFVSIAIFFFFPIVLFNKELGTALLIALTFIVIAAYVTDRVSFLVVGLMLIAFAISVGTLLDDHVAKRVFATWLDWRDYAFKPYGNGRLFPGYQIFTAIAAIKLSPWGVGLGNGILKHSSMDKTVVPLAVNDFISIPIVSELGIVALFIVGMAFIVLLVKVIPENRLLTFKGILAAGIGIALVTQAFYNLSSVIALLPPTGVPLPWVSAGGSAILANYILVAVWLAISSEKEKTSL